MKKILALLLISSISLSAVDPLETNLKQVFGTDVSVGSGVIDAGTQRCVLPTNQSAIPISSISGAVSLPTGAATSALQTSGNASLSSIDTKLTNPLPVSAASLPLPIGAATEASLVKLPLAQGSTTPGQSGPLIQAAVTTSSPTYVNGQTSPLNMDTGGNLRVITTGSTNISQVGGVAVSTGNGVSGTGVQRVTLASDSTGQVTLAMGSNTIGALTANQSVNQTQINGVAVSVGSGTTGTGVQRVVLPTDQGAIPVNATIVTSTLATYRAANISIALATTTDDFFTITGSGTKTVKVISSNCNFTGGGLVYAVQLLKRSTANSGGTSTVATAVPVDSTSAAATATVRAYTADPTLGTLVGVLAAKKLGSPLSSGTVTPGVAEYNFSVSTGQPIVLRGTSEVLAWNGNGVTGSTNGSCDFTWTEE